MVFHQLTWNVLWFFLIIELEEGKQVFLSPLNHITLLFLDSQVFLYLIYFINIFKYFNINNFRVLESINQYSQHVLPVDLGLHIILNEHIVLNINHYKENQWSREKIQKVRHLLCMWPVQVSSPVPHRISWAQEWPLSVEPGGALRPAGCNLKNKITIKENNVKEGRMKGNAIQSLMVREGLLGRCFLSRNIQRSGVKNVEWWKRIIIW